MFLLTAMGPPGGGRQQISRRLQSRFNLINMTFPSVRKRDFSVRKLIEFIKNKNHEIGRIFGSMLKEKFSTFDDDIKSLLSNLTKATVDLYRTVEQRYLPTPTKIHYVKTIQNENR